MTTIRPLPRERRHTWHFIRFASSASPVYLDTEVDATQLVKHRRTADRAYSVVSYVTRAVGRTLSRFPEANAAYAGRFRPRIATYRFVDAKLTLDKTIRGQRVVMTAVVPRVESASLDQIQDTVERLRDSPPWDIPELRGTLALQRLPILAGRIAFDAATRLRSRRKRMGTVAVTSLGNQPVLRFFSSGGTALTIGLGQIIDRPAVRSGGQVIHVLPILPVSLTFDHRILDGALAAELLATLKQMLEAVDDDPA